MYDIYHPPAVYSLSLSNGVQWHIRAGQSGMNDVVTRFADAMMLEPADEPLPGEMIRCVSVDFDDVPSMKLSLGEKSSSCIVPRVWRTLEPSDFLHFVNMSATILADAHESGSVPLHAALAEYGGQGIVLAGRGGSGKTTLSRRLSPPWKSLSDDATFAVCDDSGKWNAHPWPTWSQFCDADGGRWNVRHSVPIVGIFFLDPSSSQAVEPMGKGEGLGLLLQACIQVTCLAANAAGPELKRKMNQRWFEQLADMADKIPLYSLRHSLEGEFWREIQCTLFKPDGN